MTANHPESNAELQALVGPQFVALADALAGQPASIANHASLCEGWTVSNLVAHMTMAARYDADAFQAELASVGYDFQKLSDTIAQRDGQIPFDELLDNLRSETMAQWAPPGGGAAGALSHVLIHGLDITTAIGAARTATDEATRHVLDSLTLGGVHEHFGTKITGLALRATDLTWSFGDGEPVHADAAELILAIAGRTRPSIRLSTGP